MGIKIYLIFLLFFVISKELSCQHLQFHVHHQLPEEHTVIDPTKLLFCLKFYPLTRDTKVFFIIHGWLHTINETYVTDIRNVLFKKYINAVVVEVDWANIARKDYEDAQKYNSILADGISSALYCLVKYFSIKHTNIELICHCMGCHIAGIAGKKILIDSGKKIGRITALDPSGPAYFSSQPNKRLNSEDADVVLVVHTDSYMFGYGSKCGTVDIYPNGGRAPQPGCPDKESVIEYTLCSHKRSVSIYIEALNGTDFCGVQCPNFLDYKRGLCSSNRKINFAHPIPCTMNGTYFLVTGPRAPFLIKTRL